MHDLKWHVHTIAVYIKLKYHTKDCRGRLVENKSCHKLTNTLLDYIQNSPCLRIQGCENKVYVAFWTRSLHYVMAGANSFLILCRVLNM